MLRLIGRVRAEHVRELERLMKRSGSVSLDLEQATLVDAEVIKFLATCVKRGVPVLNCVAYITEWIAQEQKHHP